MSIRHGRNFIAIMALIIMLTPYTLYAVKEVDVDNNGAMDIANGGTNAQTVQAARNNLGLGNVDNTHDADKPISTATQAALDTKIETIQPGTNISVDNTDPKHPIVNATGGGGGTTDLHSPGEIGDVLPAPAHFTALQCDSLDVTDSAAARNNLGLGNVDNTHDANKPISTATQAALDTKIESIQPGTNVTVDNTDPLHPVVNSTGTDDQTAAEVPFTPDGSISATNTQDAIIEVRDEALVDLTSPGPIGTATPSEGHFTSLDATSFNFGEPSQGETGEIVLQEDPANGTHVTGWKAPAVLNSDIMFFMPGIDGTSGQALITDGALHTSFATFLSPADIGTTVQGHNQYLDDLSDGTLSESAIDPAIARDTELNLPVAAPTASKDLCTAGQWSYDDAFYYICSPYSAVSNKTDVSFTASSSTITSPTDPLGARVVVGSILTVSGSTSNDGGYTVSAITDDNNVVVTPAPVDEAAGANMSITKDAWKRVGVSTW